MQARPRPEPPHFVPNLSPLIWLTYEIACLSRAPIISYRSGRFGNFDQADAEEVATFQGAAAGYERGRQK